MSRVDHGTVEIEFGEDDVVVLKPTLDAYKKIDKRFGGLRLAIEEVTTMNIEKMALMVAIGSGKGQREAGELEDKIFKLGAVAVMGKLSQYLAGLMNPTGKDPSETEEPDSGE